MNSRRYLLVFAVVISSGLLAFVAVMISRDQTAGAKGDGGSIVSPLRSQSSAELSKYQKFEEDQIKALKLNSSTKFLTITQTTPVTLPYHIAPQDEQDYRTTTRYSTTIVSLLSPLSQVFTKNSANYTSLHTTKFNTVGSQTTTALLPTSVKQKDETLQNETSSSSVTTVARRALTTATISTPSVDLIRAKMLMSPLTKARTIPRNRRKLKLPLAETCRILKHRHGICLFDVKTRKYMKKCGSFHLRERQLNCLRCRVHMKYCQWNGTPFP